MSMLLPIMIVAVAAMGSTREPDALAQVRPPRSVKVLPVFFVPKGAAPHGRTGRALHAPSRMGP